VDKPIIGRALPTTCLAVIPTLLVSGSVVSGVLAALMLYPFVHLWFRWVAYKSKRSANFCKRTGVRWWS